jgi:hypothetical protein
VYVQTGVQAVRFLSFWLIVGTCARLIQPLPLLSRPWSGPGMYNLGNTCFLNATLQCLAYLPPLAQFVLSSERCYATGAAGEKGAAPGPGQGPGGFMRSFTGMHASWFMVWSMVGSLGPSLDAILDQAMQWRHNKSKQSHPPPTQQAGGTGTRCCGRC